MQPSRAKYARAPNGEANHGPPEACKDSTSPTCEGSSSLNDSSLAELLERITDLGVLEAAAGSRRAVSPEEIEALLRDHPHADRLRSLLPTLQVLASFKSSGFSASAPDAASEVDRGGQQRSGSESAHAKSPSGGARGAANKLNRADVHHSPLARPLVLGEFCLKREIGRGGMGIVYEAEQPSLRRRVAVKVLPLAGLLDDRLLKRFHIEAQAAACLAHDNIVPIYCVGCDRDIHYYAMQFIDGDSLAHVIANRKSLALPPENGQRQVTAGLAHYHWVAELGVAAAEALHHAHEAGIIHRDVKPSNLLLDTSGKLWITDFGLARIEGDGNLTMTGDCLGTLRYMSPEQVVGNPLLVDHRTDVYSLGATLYELLTLEPAVPGSLQEEIQRRVAVDAVRAPRQIVRDMPPDLETIVLKALAHDRSERYATAGEMGADFARFLSHRPIAARRPTMIQRLAKWSRRNRTLAKSLSWSLLLLVIGASLAAWFIGKARDDLLLERQERQHQAQLARIAQQSIDEQAYVSGINIAAHAAQRNNMDGIEQVLGELVPDEGKRDLRGFEWHYLRNLARSRPQLIARHEGEAYCVRFSPDGQRLATAGAGGVRIWQWPSMTCEGRLAEGEADVNAVAWSPDGRLLVTVGDDAKARVFEVPHWNPVKTLEFDGPLVAVSFTGGGELLVIGERSIEVERQIHGENRVHVFETREWTHRGELPGTRETLRGMAVSANAEFIAAAGHSGEIVIWELKSLKELHRLEAGIPLTTLAFTREPSIFLAGGSGNSILTFDAASGKKIGELTGNAGGLEDIAFAPADDALISVGRNGGAYVWERDAPNRWRLALTFAHTHPLWSLAVHADGTLVTTDRFGNIWRSNRFAPQDRVRLTSDLADFAAARTAGLRDSVIWDLAWSPDGREFATAGDPGEVTFWDAATHRPIEVQPTKLRHVVSLAYSPSGRQLAVASPQGLICLCERDPFRIEKSFQAPPYVRCLAFSSDGATLFAYPAHPELPISAFALPALELAMDRVPSSCRSIAWVPANSYSFEFLLEPQESFDLSGAARTLRQHAVDYCVSGDGNTVVGHHSDDSYHVFSGPDWRRRGIFTGRHTHMALTPDGQTLATLVSEKLICLFSTSTGRELMTLEPHLHACSKISFSPDGQRLLAAGQGQKFRGEIIVWEGSDHPSRRPESATSVAP